MELYELSAILWAFGVASAAVLSLGGIVSNRLDTLTHFAPLYLVGGLVAIALQLVRGKQRGRWGRDRADSAAPRLSHQTLAPTSFDIMTVHLSRIGPRDSGAWPSPDTFGRHFGAWASFGDTATGYTVVGAYALWPAPAGRQQIQTAFLASRLQAFNRDNLILAGDFNSTPWSFSLRRQDALFGLTRRSHALFSWSVQPYSRYKFWTPVPLMPIDHVYAGAAWKTVSVTTGPKLGSDHLPIIAVLTR